MPNSSNESIHTRVQKLFDANGGQLTKRNVFKYLGYTPMFQSVYDHMLDEGEIEEYGSGKKGDPLVVRLKNNRNI